MSIAYAKIKYDIYKKQFTFPFTLSLSMATYKILLIQTFKLKAGEIANGVSYKNDHKEMPKAQSWVYVTVVTMGVDPPSSPG